MRKRISVLSLSALALSLGLASCSQVDVDESTKPVESIPTTPSETNTIVTITFKSQGETILKDQSGKVGDKLSLPTPTLKGYNFIGWYEDAEFKTPFTATTYPSSSMTLYAKWDAIYHKLSMVLNNGEKTSINQMIEASELNLATPTLEGASFAGWYLDNEYKTKFDGIMPSSDTTIYAKWEALESTLFVSPDGFAEASGDFLDPLNIDTALSKMASSESNITHIYLKGGTYNRKNRIIIEPAMSGDFKNRNVIAGIDGDNLVTFNFSEQANGQYGIQIRADYIYLANVISEKAGSYGILVSGNHNIVENCITRYNRNSGLGIARYDDLQNSLDTYPSDNLILKCTSHDNFDYNNYGEDADGFTAKLTSGHNNVFDSCISFGNSDDGWDLYSKSSSGNTGVTKIINCVAFRNGFLSNTNDPNNNSPYDNGRTRDGDGNGFKLGGEVMYTNVYLENCLSFENGASGFADNSNPGTLNLLNCTAYNNGLFEQDKTSNYDLARTEDSLNVYEGLVSVSINGQMVTNEDDFRGPTSYSVFLGQNEDGSGLDYYAIYDVINGNSRIKELSGTKYNLNSEEVFKNTDISKFYTQNVESSYLVHDLMRNEDGSINLGDFMDIKDGSLLTFNQGKAIGSNFNKQSMSEYNHSINREIPNDATTDEATAIELYNQLFLVCDENAVYEDLDLYKRIRGYSLEWKSSNSDIIYIDYENQNPKDATKGTDTYWWAKVINPSADTDVILTATIRVNDVVLEKSFKVTVKALNPIMGDIEGLDDYTIYQGDSLNEDNIVIPNLNGRGTNIDASLLDIKKTYFYTIYKEERAISNIDTRIPGLYRVEYEISLKGTNQVKTRSINIEVVNAYMPISINSIESLTTGVNLNVNWASGKAYLVAVKKGSAAPTAEQIKAGIDYTVNNEVINVVAKSEIEINNTNVNVTLKEPLYGEYTYYAVIENQNGYSDVVSVDAVVPTYVSNANELYELASRNVSNKEYIILQNDIDLLGFDWKITDGVIFSGVFAGNNHTIKNLTINYDGTLYAGLFAETNGAVIENLNLENIKIEALTSTGVGSLIGKANETTVNNVKVTNVSATGTEAIGGVIGQTGSGNVYLNRISVINSADYLIVASKRYAGGIVGCFMGGPNDDSYNEIVINNVYVDTIIKTGTSGYAGSVVGRIKGNQNRVLEINNAILKGSIDGKYAGATTGGSDKNVLGCKVKLSKIISEVKIITNNKENGTMYGRLQSQTLLGLTMNDTYFVKLSSGDNAYGTSTKQNANNEISEEMLTEKLYNSLFDLDKIWLYQDGNISLR